MKTFEEYLNKMGYSWNDFDRTYEMEGLIERYADEKIKQALTIPVVVGQSEQFYCKDYTYHKVGRCSKQCAYCKDVEDSLQ